MIKRLLTWPGLTFALVFAWKLLLVILSAQPIPSNDSFFYDGPVVNFLLHGKYVNPSLALTLPISGTQVFSAYPPLYQLLLLPWMFVFGTSALSAIVFHLALFGVYLLVLVAILRQVQTPTWCLHVAGAFLLVVTFHDRPDSLAHLLGMLAVYAWVRSRAFGGHPRASPGANRWAWAMAGCIVLSLSASLQIGSVYSLLVWLGTLTATLFAKDKFRIAPMLATLFVPVALGSIVAFGIPHLWAGFLEHAGQTPSFTGWRRPRLLEILKMVRTVPAVLAVSVLLPWWLLRKARVTRAPQSASENAMLPVYETGFLLVTLACTSAALAVVVACLFLLTPNTVAIAAYLQPLIVGAYLAFSAPLIAGWRWGRLHLWLLLLLAGLGSVRAIGMTTWGLACAANVGYSAAIHHVREELDTSAQGQTIVLSAAYLYEAARHTQVRWIHSDWLHKFQPGQPSESEALAALRPAKVIVTQFDFYRRYQPVLAELKSRPHLVEFQINQTAKVPAPDSIASLQKVVQHISWAPVIVTFSWK